MTAIKTQNLTKIYKGKKAVDDLCMNVNEGELFSLLGVNGAGKTTTIKMLSCLAQPTSGDAFLMGHSIRKEPMEIKKIINVSPQETAVARNLTVTENLELSACIYGMSGSEAKRKAEEMTEIFSLGDYAKSKAKTLSGGTQRRLSIALALISSPKIIFLDEPTLGLDVIARRELWKEITKLKGGMTIILTTHYLEEAEALSDRIGIMNAGRMAAVGTSGELIAATGCASFEDAFIRLAVGGDEI